MQETISILLCVLLFLNGCDKTENQQNSGREAKSVEANDNSKTYDYVVIPVTEQQMAIIKTLPEELVCVTSAKNPIQTLAGLEDDEFWVFGLSPTVPTKLMAAFGRKNTAAGLGYVGLGNEIASFEKTQHLRLYITDERRAKILEGRGGVRIKFQLDNQK
jgi:hypothetical protein